jgi:hypothetical protein
MRYLEIRGHMVRVLILFAGSVAAAAMMPVMSALSNQPPKGVGITAMLFAISLAWLVVGITYCRDEVVQGRTRLGFGFLLLGCLPSPVGILAFIAFVTTTGMRID